MSRGMAAGARGRAAEVEDMILKLCADFPDGVKQNQISECEPGLKLPEIRAALNALLGQHRMEMLQDREGVPVFKTKSAAEAAKFKGLTEEDMLILQHIQKSGNQGLWTKDMKTRTNLQQPQITKILKQLESRKLIKAVKSVASANRKVYMEYDVEPSREITGGAWYTDHNLDDEFVNMLRQACLGYIERNKEPTLAEIAAFIRNKQLTKEALRDEDFGMILETLCLDGKVERLQGGALDGSDDRFAQPAIAPLKTTALTSMPCGVCPVAADCSPDGAISPATCVYYQEWLY